ncbi:FAD dependent oxidoreductase [Apiospora arundinis]|uniref:FAD dependent oxidoreductase n=1 Tax=Apiospora arundinis TaxID=335852 RepID=A0ABR2JFN2_9PEZI
MHSFKIQSAVGLLATCLVSEVAAGLCSKSDAVERDVVVIGGGAAGSHAAVWLRDHGKTVALVEKQDTLGGHTSVYHDPATGTPINVGVQAWMEYKDTFDFVKRMGVSTNGSMHFASLKSQYVDFQTGKRVDGYVAPADAAKFAALQVYLDACEKYESMLLPGFFNFPEPANIPEDLLMPFGQFVDKYGIAAAVPQLWQSTVQGVGNFLDVPTMYIMQASPAPMVRALLGKGAAAVPPSGNLHELYERIGEFLGDDVQYSSQAVASTRTEDDGVTVTVQSNTDNKNCTITAKRLVIAIEPTADNMAPFDLEPFESDVLGKLGYTTVYAGIVRHPSLKVGTSYGNTLPGAAPANYTVYPLPAQIGRFDYLDMTTDMFSFTAVGTDKDTPASMRALIGKTIEGMVATGVAGGNDARSQVEFPAFADHGMMHSRISAEELRAGFIQEQLSLQGRRSTWYTGAAFTSAFSTVLWEYNNVLLPDVIKDI